MDEEQVILKQFMQLEDVEFHRIKELQLSKHNNDQQY